jgi:transcriptional regulator with XRE-family HTH domain
MRAKRASEHELVGICLAELCKIAGFEDREHLVQRDLQYLSESIESKTGILISLSTIRRLLNGQFSRLPQIATLDAISLFLGYSNWQQFKISKAAQTKVSAKSTSIHIFPKVKWQIWGVLLILIAIGLLAIRKNETHRLVNIDKAHFSAVKVTGNDLPNTVIFTYNIDSVLADSFFIQQSWDKNRRVKIYKNSHTLTDIYYEPGFHTAKLIANDQIIKTLEVSIPTDRWFYYAQQSFGSQPKYINPVNTADHRLLKLTQEDLSSNKIDIQNENQYLMVYFPSRIESTSDNFRLKFKIKVNPLKNDLCPYFMSEVFCQRHFMYFNSTLNGCVSELGAEFGEKRLNGKTSDLSKLGSNVKAWNQVELLVKNKNISIRINDKELFSAIYQESCGLITGLGFISNGLCLVDSVDLKTLDGNPIYPTSVDP